MPASMACRASGESWSTSKGRPAPTPIVAKRAMSSTSEGWVGAKLQVEVQEIEELERCLLGDGRKRLGEVDRRRGLRCGPAEEGRQRQGDILGLDLFDGFEVAGIVELRPNDAHRKLRLAIDCFRDARGRLPAPARTGDEEAAAVIARRAAAEVVEVVGVEVNQLEAPVAILGDGRHGEDDGFRAQVQADQRIGRVRVRRLDGRVRGREDLGDVEEVGSTALCIRDPLDPRNTSIARGRCPRRGSRRCRPLWRWPALPKE